jgi:hypothetical protein
MTTDPTSDPGLDALLDEARSLRAEPGPDLMARILADAAAHQPGRVAPVLAAPARLSWLALLGGWPALGSLAASALAGLWIGLAPPTALASAVTGLWGEGVSLPVGLDDGILSLLDGTALEAAAP